MIRLIKTKRCPTCGGADFTRYPRSLWMRWLFPRRLLLVCRQCRTRTLLARGAVRSSPDESSVDQA